jgi:hypothetical protein
VQGQFERSARVWRELTEFAEHGGLDERVVTALQDVAMTGRVRRSRYDLRDLVSADVLQAIGRTRARYYEAGLRFPVDVLTTAGTPTVVTDPYAVSPPAAERPAAR